MENKKTVNEKFDEINEMADELEIFSDYKSYPKLKEFLEFTFQDLEHYETDGLNNFEKEIDDLHKDIKDVYDYYDTISQQQAHTTLKELKELNSAENEKE